MKKNTLFLVHLSFWLYTFFFMEIALQISYGKSWQTALNIFDPIAISNYFIFLSIFYCNYLVVLPRFLKKSAFGIAALSWILLIAVFTLMRYYIQEVWVFKVFNACNYCEFKPISYIIAHFFQAITWILLPSTVIWLLDSTLKAERKNLALQQEKLNSERAYLQAQLNPHFVFNSLHTIYSMVFHNAKESLDTIKHFSDILRHALNPNREELILISQELEHLKKYITLQEHRLEKLALQLTIEGNITNYKVPPLLLITFVENTFKHGILTDSSSPIQIKLKTDKTFLFFSIKNKINPNRDVNSTSIGLSSMKRILEITYGDRHDLKIIDEEGYYEVILTIK